MKNNFKDLRKAAFAVGFGLTMGKYAAKVLQAAIDGAIIATVKSATKGGNEIAQNVCEKKDSTE